MRSACPDRGIGQTQDSNFDRAVFISRMRRPLHFLYASIVTSRFMFLLNHSCSILTAARSISYST